MPTLVSKIFEFLQPFGKLALTGPQALAFMPALTLAAYWLFGEKALLIVAITVPLLLASTGLFELSSGRRTTKDNLTGLPDRKQLIEHLDDLYVNAPQQGFTTACLVITLDDFAQVRDRFGSTVSDAVLREVGHRLVETCREKDVVARLHGASFAVALMPVLRADLEDLIQLSGRIQSAINEPIGTNGASTYITASIGFCLAARSPEAGGKALLEASETAMIEARRRGPCAIRAFSIQMKTRAIKQDALMGELEGALNSGQIRPWFQPQISTDTGLVTGFEALARWDHPERGLIPPAEFLPSLEAGGQLERLCEVMLFQSLSALRSWDQAGLKIPSISVNFSGDELRNPKFAEKVEWELDRFGLAPQRLAVEILETVVTGSEDDIIIRNIAALSKLGCRIDLDDFGTGNASIRHLRRFAVSRIKIDRSFVTKVDRDKEQQNMVAAILTMAEQLKLETLAEGVETTGEHAMLSQLGCDHVQGFGISRPLPFEETISWYERHSRKIDTPPKIPKRTN